MTNHLSAVPDDPESRHSVTIRTTVPSSLLPPDLPSAEVEVSRWVTDMAKIRGWAMIGPVEVDIVAPRGEEQ